MLAFFKSDIPELMLMQTQWAGQLNPALSNPLLGGSVLKGVVLASGTNYVNHLLGRALQGWFPVRVRASATFYDLQDSNTMPDRTLKIVSSAAVTVDLFVF